MHGSVVERAKIAPDTRAVLTRGFVRLLGILTIVAGLALAFIPYSRSLQGDLNGSTVNVESNCGVPLTEALAGSSSTALQGEGIWADGPPCQRTARFRAGLGGLLIAAGIVVVIRQRTTRQPVT